MSVAYGGIVAFAFRGGNVLLALATVVLTSNQLGPEGRGTFVLGITAVGIVNAVMGGLTAAIAYQVSNQRREPGAALLHGGAVAGTLSALAVVAGITAMAALNGDAADLSLSVGVSAAAVIVMSAIAGVYLGNGALVRYNLALVAPPLFSLVGIALTILVLDRHTPAPALAAYAVGQWLAVLALLAAGAARMVRGVHFEQALVKAMARFAVVAGVASGVSYLNYRADVFVVEHFEGKEGVALYANAVYIGESVWQLSGSLALATYARIGALDRAAAAELTARVMRHTLLILGVVCTVLFAVSGVLVDLLFDREFAGTASAVRFLLPGTLIYGLAASFSAFYTYQRGQPWASAVIAGAGLAIDLGLDFVLVPRMGVDGAALASAIAYSSAMVGGLAVFVRSEHLRPSRVFLFGAEDVADYRALLGRLRTAMGR